MERKTLQESQQRLLSEVKDLQKQLAEAEEKGAAALAEAALIREENAVFKSFPQSAKLRDAVKVGFGHISLCTDALPLRTTFTERFGASHSEAATRPRPTAQAVRKKQTSASGSAAGAGRAAM